MRVTVEDYKLGSKPAKPPKNFKPCATLTFTTKGAKFMAKELVESFAEFETLRATIEPLFPRGSKAIIYAPLGHPLLEIES